MGGGKSWPTGTAEFLAALEQDEEYQRRRAVFRAGLEARTAVLRIAEEPIVADLRSAGFSLDSVWDLVNTSEPYPAALPMLMDHLERGGYPDRVTESLGRALALKPSVIYWHRLAALYVAPRNPGEETGTAVALSACATKAQLDDLISFLALEKRGESRIFFLRPINRLGGQRGRDLIESLKSDPVFGKEVHAILKSRRRKASAASSTAP